MIPTFHECECGYFYLDSEIEEHRGYCLGDRTGMANIGLAISWQAAFIMGYTRGRTPGRVRARRELREANERRIAEFDRAKAMMLSYEDLLAAAYKQRDEAKEHLADLQEEINELREDNRELDRELGRWQDAAWDANHGY